MSDYRACFVIPFYNHGRPLPRTVEALLSFDLPIIIVNDGSDEENSKVLFELAGKYEEKLIVHHLSQNGGKGVATWNALRISHENDFTHALQIDADGQHNFNDIERFFKESKSSPETYVLGQATYDESVPKARLYGRYITHIWVWIETLSFAIKDTMCGFRVYVVEDFMSCFPDKAPSPRMDFDTEVLVRLFWKGKKFKNLKTLVVYPEDGISHFQPFKSNVRISWMHTRLFFGMLLRSPLLLLRKMM
ncbi:MAG: glycosyltransferase family 2 protein [Lentisphaeraceae bacterium]|nr:glycosyltransferase family 2 protein [Lentisphaeraceae bacterium]